MCWFLYGPFCHGVHKLAISTLFATFFLWTSLALILQTSVDKNMNFKIYISILVDLWHITAINDNKAGYKYQDDTAPCYKWRQYEDWKHQHQIPHSAALHIPICLSSKMLGNLKKNRLFRNVACKPANWMFKLSLLHTQLIGHLQCSSKMSAKSLSRKSVRIVKYWHNFIMR